MTNKNYVALHNHSDYSSLDGYGTIDEYIQAAKNNNMIGIGLSDHGTASGLYKFITRAQAAGLIPVPGVEFYLAPENPEGAKARYPIYYGQGGNRAPKYDLSNGAYSHLTVFAYNNKGLENLFRLTSLSWKPENYYFKPRIDTNMLAEHSEGLIVTTGCPSSEINRRFLLGQDKKAYEFASRLKNIFGDRLYVEVMDHKMKDDELERIINPKLIKLSKDLNIPPILTNDSHYAFKHDHEPHERILAVSTNSSMDIPRKSDGGTRFAFSTPEYYIKSYDEMIANYDNVGYTIPEGFLEEALENTVNLTERCKDIKFEYNPHLRPEIDIPEGYTSATYLQKLIYEGFKKKRGDQPKELQEESVRRIKEEFKVIHSNDFISYFLVVHDYLSYAHKEGILIGSGRGSIGGSEIAYVLDISNTDPIRFDLLFERFLSPGRGSLYQIDYVSGESEEIPVSDKKCVYSEDGEKIVYVHELNPGDLVNYGDDKKVIQSLYVVKPGSAPDVDTDIHTEGREKVVQYIVDKYGEDNVANIITFGTFKAKKAFKAMSTIYKVPFPVANKISSLIPGGQGAELSLKTITDPTSPRYAEGKPFRDAINTPTLQEAVEMGVKVEGRVAETGVHACGLIISSKPLAGIIPTQVRQEDGKVIAQWEYAELESLGLIKMDLLGLELLNTVQQTLDNIKLSNLSAKSPSEVRQVPDMRELVAGPMDDPRTYELLEKANTTGIFQLGSPGVRDLLKRAKPKSFVDIATITALYRPGPMSVNAHLDWADRKNGVKEIVYLDERLHGTVVEDILKDTAGIVCFQEQLMQLATRYSNMTPQEADLLRKAMGKKKIDLMMSLHGKFIEGAIEKGSTKELAELVWSTMEGFGSYGFNKSHSVSYAINIYQTLYLKAHFPSEFMAAIIQQGFGSPNKIKAREYIQEAQRMNLKIGPVDINHSQVQMASTGIARDRKYDIVYGFSGVRELGNSLAHEIVAERNENGLFESVADFVKRMSKRSGITKAPLANLALAGAFDSFGISRYSTAKKAKILIDAGVKNANKGVSLFDMMGGSFAKENDVVEAIDINGADYDYTEMIKKEAHVVGLYVSGHPTSNLGHIAKMYNPTTIKNILATNGSKESFNVLGTITDLISKTSRAGKKSIAIMIDDGEETASTYLPKYLVDAIDKGELLKKLKKEKSEIKITDEMNVILNDESIAPREPLELNHPYLFKMKTRGWGEKVNVVVTDIVKLNTAPDGSLPYEVRARMDHIPLIEELTIKHKAKTNKKNKKSNKAEAYVKIHLRDAEPILLSNKVKLSLDFIMDMEKIVGKYNIITEGI